MTNKKGKYTKIKSHKIKKIKKINKKKSYGCLYLVILLLVLIVLISLWLNRRSKNRLYANSGERVEKIVEIHQDKIFGIDMSHYQRRDRVVWDSLFIKSTDIPINFIVLRATMGAFSEDKNFNFFWNKVQKKGLIRGAYHYYRPDEDPTLQAQNFIRKIKLNSGDMLPILDVEKAPRRISKRQYLENVKIWLHIVETKYGKPPIIYTYSHFYQNFFDRDFDDYPFWVANYTEVEYPNVSHWKLWQFTEKGEVTGIKTKVDLNVFNGNMSDFESILLK